MRRSTTLALALLGLGAAACDPGGPGDGGPGGGKGDGFELDGGLPEPNADEPPPADWAPPDVEAWPDAYVVFNNTGCGHDCTTADQAALKERSVMRKLLVAAIDSAEAGEIVRVANFNISSSSTVAPVTDALVRAIGRGAIVRIAMDVGQATPESKTSKLAADGAEVRFSPGLTFDGFDGTPQQGILHSKMLIVGDRILMTGSNNFSSTGLVTNEENSVVLRSTEHADRIAAFACDFDAMFAAGAAPGEAFPSDEDPTRRAAIEGLEACVTADAWFPPVGTIEDRSVTFGVLSRAIRDAKQSIDLAPDMLSHPGIKAALEARARRAVADGDDAFRIRLVLDASPEAFGNPAFGTCLVEAAAEDDLPIEVRYWPGSEEIFQLLHHKFMIVDAASTARAVFNGSANYSPKAMKQSWENVTRFKGARFRGVIDAFVGRFERIFDEAMSPEQLEDEEGTSPPACPS